VMIVRIMMRGVSVLVVVIEKLSLLSDSIRYCPSLLSKVLRVGGRYEDTWII
jgi:hypothetical protein